MQVVRIFGILCVLGCAVASIHEEPNGLALGRSSQCADYYPSDDCMNWKTTYGCAYTFSARKIVATVCPQTCNICDLPSDPVEQAALEALYNGTGGPSWDASSGWTQADVPHCQWLGVGCINVNETIHVTTLLLSGNNLTGSIPAALGNLSQLTHL